MNDIITLDNVTKHFPVRGPARESHQSVFTALDKVSLRIGHGEFLVLVGPSGCGKSTLLDLLAGLTMPSSGSITMHGQPVRGPSHDRGVVFQQYALLPWRTARGNVEFGLEAKTMPRRQRRARAMEHLKLVGLSRFAEHYPHELSGGMKQRVAIARSLAVDPEVLLMDEPFAAVDAQTRQSLQDELTGIWKATGKAIIFITHDIDEAVHLGQRVAVLPAEPGPITTTIDIRLPERGTDDDPRATPEFAHHRHQVWTALRDQQVNGTETTGELTSAQLATPPQPRRGQVSTLGQHA